MDELSEEFIAAGWGDIDLDYALFAVDTALDYMDEHGYF
jgi:hypothetical protein